jgi:4-hydroxyphenylacetate 3-monooxygenase
MDDGDSPYALNFSIPCNTQGVQFLCRESFDLGRSRFDHPLGSRFEEMDAIVFFDDVLVPWERVFLLGDVDLVNDTAVATGSHIHTAHQGAAKNIAKSELVLGVALLMAETLGSTQVPHIQERLAELMVHTEVMKASLRAAEADAKLDRWGVMCPAGLPLEVIRTLFMNVYPRMVEILQLLGSSSLMIIPSEADFQSVLKPKIEQYLATDTASARERVKLFRLAWDIACSAFGGRQVLYERFFAGDPMNRAQFLYSIYPKEAVKERIHELLADDDAAS